MDDVEVAAWLDDEPADFEAQVRDWEKPLLDDMPAADAPRETSGESG